MSFISDPITQSCCNDMPPLRRPEDVVDVLKAIADPTRLRLLYVVAERGCEDVCGCDLAEAMRVSAPTITHHMKKLVNAGLVTREQHGKWAHFSINKEVFCHIQQLVDALHLERQPVAS